ncbi:hypothetical protein CAEBREN_29540 [Caenorhabditis brenneri]|uniref:Uncharacterized protein n=1 Tax=Caenorhabditis brenneri TaxID=135651 RepID=G0MCM0_CAEBE|nr:hypothetical protein CAEBREN_29540 [Caenorhabditis brenneri]
MIVPVLAQRKEVKASNRLIKSVNIDQYLQQLCHNNLIRTLILGIQNLDFRNLERD